MKIKLIAAAALAGLSGMAGSAHAIGQQAPAPAQNATFYQTCAMQARLAADLVGLDARSKDTPERVATERALRTYADTLERRETDALAAGYEQAAAFGWDRARVDREHAALGAAAKASHIDPVLAEGRIKSDLALSLDTCARGDMTALGQSREDLGAALQQLLVWAQG